MEIAAHLPFGLAGPKTPGPERPPHIETSVFAEFFLPKATVAEAAPLPLPLAAPLPSQAPAGPQPDDSGVAGRAPAQGLVHPDHRGQAAETVHQGPVESQVLAPVQLDQTRPPPDQGAVPDLAPTPGANIPPAVQVISPSVPPAASETPTPTLPAPEASARQAQSEAEASGPLRSDRPMAMGAILHQPERGASMPPPPQAPKHRVVPDHAADGFAGRQALASPVKLPSPAPGPAAAPDAVPVPIAGDTPLPDGSPNGTATPPQVQPELSTRTLAAEQPAPEFGLRVKTTPAALNEQPEQGAARPSVPGAQSPEGVAFARAMPITDAPAPPADASALPAKVPPSPSIGPTGAAAPEVTAPSVPLTRLAPAPAPAPAPALAAETAPEMAGAQTMATVTTISMPKAPAPDRASQDIRPPLLPAPPPATDGTPQTGAADAPLLRETPAPRLSQPLP